MPCYTVQTTTVDIGKVDHMILLAALKTLGLNPRQQGDSIYFTNGVYSISEKSLDLRGSDIEQRITALKQAYTGEVIKATAKKFNWQAKLIGENKYQVVKRSF